jgi:exopolyphosphatase/guanosine-5'-triphosphate,3'-diphosphate pyrophosphatase
MRTATVARLANRFTVDAAQARRVGDTAAALFVQLAPAARGGSTEPRRPRTAQAGLGGAAA